MVDEQPPCTNIKMVNLILKQMEMNENEVQKVKRKITRMNIEIQNLKHMKNILI